MMSHKIKFFSAHVLSVMLIPLLSPTYLFFIILFFFPQLSNIIETKDKLLSILCIFAATCLPPFILVFFLYKRKIISTLTLDDKKDRFYPQVFACVNYVFISGYLIYKLGATSALTLSMIAATISVILIFIVTAFWKISTHTSGATGLLSISSVLIFKFPSHAFILPYFSLLILTIFLCLARVYLKVHTPKQVIAGCILGSIVGLAIFLVTHITAVK